MKGTVVGIASAPLVALLVLVPRVALGQCCGDCGGDGAVTVDEILTAVNHALTNCSDDDICSMERAQLAICQSDLANCRTQPAGQQFPASGQTTPYGQGSDGAVRAGAQLSYTDNGDGTITDNNTGLIWEKKDHSGGVHDLDNSYTWSGPSYLRTNIMDGTLATTFLATLNAGAGFAGHTDWRIPNVKELQSIVDYEVSADPAVHAAFNTNCALGCTVTTCSCTRQDYYWSSSTGRLFDDIAWRVYFGSGLVDGDTKSNAYSVRAVRGGL